jgi:DNA-directed RNA polymerase specialized sigma24 family protein
MSIACTRTGWVAALLAQAAGPETSSDEMLIRRIAEGDQLAMRTLFGRHRVPLYRWLLRLVGDEVLAEDLLSDVFLDVWRQAASPEHGEVIDLVYKEVAEIIGIATATVKTRMFYARKKLADFVAAA